MSSENFEYILAQHHFECRIASENVEQTHYDRNLAEKMDLYWIRYRNAVRCNIPKIVLSWTPNAGRRR